MKACLLSAIDLLFKCPKADGLRPKCRAIVKMDALPSLQQVNGVTEANAVEDTETNFQNPERNEYLVVDVCQTNFTSPVKGYLTIHSSSRGKSYFRKLEDKYGGKNNFSYEYKLEIMTENSKEIFYAEGVKLGLVITEQLESLKHWPFDGIVSGNIQFSEEFSQNWQHRSSLRGNLTIFAIFKELVLQPGLKMIATEIKKKNEVGISASASKNGPLVTIISSCGCEIECDRDILCRESQVFRSMLTSGMLEDKCGKVRMLNVSGASLRALVQFLNVSDLQPIEEDSEITIQLLEAAEMYSFKTLCAALFRILIQKDFSWFTSTAANRLCEFSLLKFNAENSWDYCVLHAKAEAICVSKSFN